MKSIKEFSTSGMELYEREELFENTIPIPIGEIVWKAGDAWSYEKPIKVDAENQKTVSMFWNALYFDNKQEAAMRTSIAHAAYGEYQASTAYCY